MKLKFIFNQAVTLSLGLSALLSFPQIAIAEQLAAIKSSPTKVGNGDAGNDLEKLEKVESGILVKTKEQALQKLTQLNVSSVPKLGNLIPELKGSEIFLVGQNTSSLLTSDKGGTEASPDGKFVYARTFAEPHAATRFFPASIMLSDEQLVKLHIHEALHRSLPAEIREDEDAVSQVTLAITSPDASYDRINQTLQNVLAKNKPAEPSEVGTSVQRFEPEVKQTARLKNPSYFSYRYETYNMKDSDVDLFPLQSSHQIKSYLYPFGSGINAVGLGFTFTYLNLKEKSFVGPLGLSAQQVVATWRGFDVEWFANLSAYTSSNEELKNLPKTRDNKTLGISIKKEEDNFYTENFLAVTLGGDKEFKVGSIGYTETFSPIVDARISVGTKYKGFNLGGTLDFLLTEGSEVKSNDGLFRTEKERIRMVKIGPEIGYKYNNLNVTLYAQQVLDQTPGYTLTDFADVMNIGAGQSFAGSTLTYQF